MGDMRGRHSDQFSSQDEDKDENSEELQKELDFFKQSNIFKLKMDEVDTQEELEELEEEDEVDTRYDEEEDEDPREYGDPPAPLEQPVSALADDDPPLRGPGGESEP